MLRRNGNSVYTQAEVDARLAEIDEEITKRISAKMPRNAKSAGLTPEGHLHGPHGAATFTPYDYIISDSYTGGAGAVFKSAMGTETRLYATIDAAFAHAEASGLDRSFLICSGTYQETTTRNPALQKSWRVDGMGVGTLWQATANDQTLWQIGANPEELVAPASIYINNIRFDLQSFTGCEAITDGIDNFIWIDQCDFNAQGSTSTGVTGGASVVGINNCRFRGGTTGGTGVSVAGLQSVVFSNCAFQVATGIRIAHRQGEVKIIGCALETDVTDSIIVTGNATPTGMLTIVGNELNNITFSGGSGVHNVTISANRFNVPNSALRPGIDFSGLTVDSEAVTVVGNSFVAAGASSLGIVLDSNLVHGVASNNTFRDFTAGNEISGTGGTGFQTFHNKSDAGALADSGSPVGHLPAAGTAAIVVEKDDSTISAGASIIDFLDSDATAYTVDGSAPTQEVNVTLNQYARLGGRATPQTLSGGVAANDDLTLQGTAHGTVTSARVIVSASDLQMATAGRSILDSGGNVRITTSTTTGQQVLLTGEVMTTSRLNVRSSTDSTDVTVNVSPALGTLGTSQVNLIQTNPSATLVTNSTMVAIFGQVACTGSSGATGQSLSGLDFTASGVAANASTSTFNQIRGMRAIAQVQASGASMTTNCTNLVGNQAELTIRELLSGNVSVTDAIFYNCPSPSISGTPAITNMYGFRMAAMTTATNRFPFHESGTAAGDNHGNRFRSNTQFASTTGQFGGGDGVIGVANASTNPGAGGVSGGVIMWSQSASGINKIHIRNSDGTTFIS